MRFGIIEFTLTLTLEFLGILQFTSILLYFQSVMTSMSMISRASRCCQKHYESLW